MSSAQKEHILVVIAEAQVYLLLEQVLKPQGYSLTHCSDRLSAQKALARGGVALNIIGEKLPDGSGLELAAEVQQRFPAIPLIVFGYNDSPEMVKRALRLGASDYLCLPLKSEEILQSVHNSLTLARQRRDWVLLETRRATASLQRRLDEVETLTRLGRTITSSLDLDAVLSAVVDAAVELTGAEEGSLLLLDEDSGELYMRAARNFQEDFVRTFRLPTQDTLAGAVLKSGEPMVVDEKTPQKIKTSYLVHSLVYVPLQLHGYTFGVLGIDNRVERRPLMERDIKLLMALAEYAVIAISNAGLYTNIKQERNKLETVLTHIQDGVIVMDEDQRLILVNQVALAALKLEMKTVLGRPYREVFNQKELLELLSSDARDLHGPVELPVEDGRIFSALLTPLPGIGTAITMHDITNLKKLDRIKSDFVSTVSHDLRSPLTAILGYVELIERAGPISDTQREFIHRVQFSVQSITTLINDLLNLGRIEAGFDTRKETVVIEQMVRFSAENFRKAAAEKQLTLSLDLPDSLPHILANPVQMRQMVENLLDNAVKYTNPGGTITVRGGVAQNQLVLQFSDTGIGIPAVDLPYIFDKFYRASNASQESSGTGLGLSIVKSVLESHGGRVWVDSVVGKGTTFTVVLPIIESQP